MTSATALTQAQSVVDSVRKTQPHSLNLAKLVSPAAHIGPQLIRRLRLRLLPSADVGCEADFWFSDLVD